MVGRLKRHTDLIFDLVELPQLGLLATAGQDRIICLWNLDDFKYYGCLRGHTKSIRSLCNAPAFDGIQLLSSGYEFGAYAWDIQVPPLHFDFLYASITAQSPPPTRF